MASSVFLHRYTQSKGTEEEEEGAGEHERGEQRAAELCSLTGF